jgi:adenylate cyclase
VRRRRVVTLVCGVAIALLTWGCYVLGAFEGLDRKLLDGYFVARGELDGLAPIVLVAIDYESLQRLGPWPWPRDVHGRLVQKLAAAGATVVGFDILFLDPTERDGALAAVAEEAANVVWASTFSNATNEQFQVREHRSPARTLLVPSAATGFVDLRFDPDGYVRRVPPVLPFGQQIFRSFALTIAEQYRREPLLHVSGGGTRWRSAIGPWVPTESDGTLLINFAAPPYTFPIVPFIRVLEGTVPASVFKDRIVLVGATTAPSDSFFTPFYSTLFVEMSRLMPGVEIHANIVDMFLRGRFLSRLDGWMTFLLFVGIGLTAGILGRRGLWVTLGALPVCVTAPVVIGYVLFVTSNEWVPAAALSTSTLFAWGAVTLYGFVSERKEKHVVRATLERYVSPALVREVIDQGVDLALGGKRQPLTILFSDIRGFTGIAERIPPEMLVGILCQHFARAGEIIHRHGGTLDKFIGDAVMAFWGAPTPRTDHGLCAVRAALEMQVAARELSALVRDQVGEDLRIGIGINSGEAVVGNIGSPTRMEYTAVGDPVNLASRIESMTRQHQVDILITQFTYELVKYDVDAEPLGSTSVRGRTDPIAIYRVVGLKSTPQLTSA